MIRAALVLLALTRVAAADPDVCASPTNDPVPVGARAAGFDAVRAACLRDQLVARVDTHVLVDVPGFYGTVGGGLAVGASFVESRAFEWGASVRVADITFAQTAVVAATEARFGPVEVHAAVHHARSARVHLAGVLTAELPLTRSSPRDASSAGAQLAGVITARAARRVVVHGRLAGLGWYGESAAGVSQRAAGLASIDASVRLHWGVVLVAGAEVSAGWYRGGLDHLAARLGVQGRIQRGWRVDLGTLIPLAGEERLDLALTLGVRHAR